MILFRSKLLAGVFLILACGFAGFAMNFKSCFSTNNAAAIKWPKFARLARAEQVPTLIVFLHPHCYNSTATMDELQKVLPALKGRVQVYLTIYAPEQMGDAWIKRGVWRQALKMPNVNLYLDKNGEDSELFGAQSSGEAFLYDTSGELVFHGGLTKSWALAGENKGMDAMVARVMNLDTRTVAYETPVLGRNIRNKLSMRFLDRD